MVQTCHAIQFHTDPKHMDVASLVMTAAAAELPEMHVEHPPITETN